MFKTEDIDFLASIMNSLICRRPFIVMPAIGRTKIDLKYIMSLMPSHRYILAAGEIPRWMQHLPARPRELCAANLSELEACVQEAIQEERTGSRPIQFVYFNVTPFEYEHLLKPMPKGWIAVTDDLDAIRRRLPPDSDALIYTSSEGVSVLHCGKAGLIDFEVAFFRRIGNRSKLSMSFVVQKKFAELHLAGASIMGDLEHFTESLTLPELETFFEMDAFTVIKLFELIQADYDLDIRRYFLLPEDEVVNNVNKMIKLHNIIAIGVMAQGRLVYLHRKRIIFDLDIYGVMQKTGKAYIAANSLPDYKKGHYMVLMFPDGRTVATVPHAQNIYVAFLTEQARYHIAIENILEILNENHTPL